MNRQRSTSSASRLSRQTSSSRPPLSPGIRPRPIPPSNPPEPPLTLLHPTTSRQPESFDQIEEGDIEIGQATPQNANHHVLSAKTKSTFSKFYKSIGKGMYNDIKSRAPYYISDWVDAYNYRVIPATWFIFFANVFPGIAFSLDLIETTGEYGVQEVLLASFGAALFASIFGGQPLLISGVTGPITVFNKVIYDIIIKNQSNPPVYLHFIGWVYLWGAIFHWITAVFNGVSLLKYVTRFACDTFGFYVAAVYVQYGIQVVERQFAESPVGSGYLGIVLALIVLVLPHYFNGLARSGYISKSFRRFCADYGMPITVIATSGLAYWGYFNQGVNSINMTLPVIEESFTPANRRPWVVNFWELEGKYVGIALPFGFVLFILFYFDANVSSLIAQGSEFPLRKPPGFHWDFFLLGITTFLAGLFGTPAPNGLIPQAPLHTASLVIMGFENDPSKEKDQDETIVNTPDSYRGTRLSAQEEAIEVNGAANEQSAGMYKNGSKDRRSEERGPRLRRLSTGNGELEGLKRRLSRSTEDKERRKSERMERDTKREIPVGVVEQRVSNLAQGALCLILMTKPFQHVLGLIPKGVMAGLFWYMGTDALLSSGVTEKMLYLIRDRQAISLSEPLNKVRRSRILIFLIVELIGFGATFAVTQTIAAIGFPVIIMFLIPIRIWIVPKLGISKEELDILDGPVASPFTLESVGGSM